MVTSTAPPWRCRTSSAISSPSDEAFRNHVFSLFGVRLAMLLSLVGNLVRRALERFRLPYVTVTPTFPICLKHGYLAGEHKFCPKCDEELLARKRGAGQRKAADRKRRR